MFSVETVLLRCINPFEFTLSIIEQEQEQNNVVTPFLPLFDAYLLRRVLLSRANTFPYDHPRLEVDGRDGNLNLVA